MRTVIGRYVIAACLFLGTVSNLQLTENTLKDLLSQAEWNAIMGGTDSDPEGYAVTHPMYSSYSDKLGSKSSHPGTVEPHLKIYAPSFSRHFDLHLVASPDLLAKDFQYLESFDNGTYTLPVDTELSKCYFRSEKAALELCNGVRGIVHKDENMSYIINPLPKRFHTGTSSPHILIRKPHNIHNGDNHHCRYNAITHEQSNHTLSILPEDLPHTKLPVINASTKRAKREVTVESPVFVETAVFVDRDLFDHMKTNFPIDTERELIRFVLAMINAVQLLYHDPSLGRPVNFVLKRLEILKEEVAGLSRPPDIDKFLSSFCNWQKTKNPVGDREPQHWDHALILTGLDLYVRGKHGKISSQVVGLAPVAGMCTATSSCTVNEGRHFESVYVVAHEIGHNLGMRHDGPLAENGCDPSSYLMSPTLGSGKITWSECSKMYLQKFLETPQSRCLLDHGSSAGQLDHSAEGALPGERFDANQQCMLKYGRGSRHSSQQPLDDICRDLHCERERYTWTSHPALEGTTCGHNMWCRSGRCLSKGLNSGSTSLNTKAASLRIEKVDGGWSHWKLSGECASGCLFGEEGRLRSGSTGIMVASRTCSNPRPQGGGSKCEGYEKKYQACTAQQCFNVPRLTVKEFAEQYCTRAKEVDGDLTGTGMQKVSTDAVEACVVWCQKKNGSAKSRGWTFPDGTVCQTHRSRYGKPTFCINGRCEEFSCDQYEESQFEQMPELCPTDKDDNEIIWRTSLRRRDTNVLWKSASGCHFNCISPGTGLRLVASKGKHGRSSIQMCQPDKFSCGRVKSPFEYASTVCTKYKERVRRLSGLGMQISPALEDPDRSCKIACQDEAISHRFYLVNGEVGWFPFGTDCSRGTPTKRAYCISGKCLEFGEDNTPLSESEVTLPLSRVKRSLHLNNTRITAILHQQELDELVKKLNATILGVDQMKFDKFDIDLKNPIHINVDPAADNVYFRKAHHFTHKKK